MPGSDGLRILGDFWKKAISWDLSLEEASWFSSLGQARPVKSTRCAARGGARWISQHSRNCVSLFSCWKPKSQKGNKSFVPEPRESSVFRVFRDSYACECFTYLYISHISHITNIYINVCVYIHICICLYVYVCIYKYVYIYVNICTYIYVCVCVWHSLFIKIGNYNIIYIYITKERKRKEKWKWR